MGHGRPGACHRGADERWTDYAALVAAATSAGCFGFLAFGYLTPDAARDQLSQTRGSCDTFGVNVFLPRDPAPDAAELAAYSRELASEAERYGLPGVGVAPVAGSEQDWWREKVELLVQDPVAVVSFTFAIPDAATVASLQRAGSTVLATVTTPDEARQAEAAGVDGLVVQSAAAGGHSATTAPGAPSGQADTPALVSEVRAGSVCRSSPPAASCAAARCRPCSPQARRPPWSALCCSGRRRARRVRRTRRRWPIRLGRRRS